MSEPLVYIWLGSAGSGRREIIRDTIEAGLEPDDRPAILHTPGDSFPDKPEARQTEIGEWALREDNRVETKIPEGATHIFLITDGRANPVDQIEALSKWIEEQPVELGRIVTVVNSRLCHDNPPAVGWYQACIHFSDVVLMNRREDLPQKWIAEFIERFQKEHYPCLFELVKKNRTRNPALLLHPEPRRISTLFDEFPWDDEDEAELDSDEETDGDTDPYLERLPSGRRAKEIPDISRFL